MLGGCGRSSTAELGFWFEPVSYSSPLLSGPLTAEDMAVIEKIARLEIVAAFDGLRVTLSDRQNVRYRIRVVQDIPDDRMLRKASVPGESRAIRGLGGSGAVNFTYFAGGALAYAPESATRADLVEAIGRGVGRSAVHEFTHLLLPNLQIDGGDRGSYEYYAASRPEQYFGAMRWAEARPLLDARWGRRLAAD